ncbi:fimbrial protein [Pantoea stewartii]|uniref:Fimbrial protein n=1 Tax=Pantoea stewartii TaxID=66269 RepID=A0AB34VFC0_9GAMM|nr:fimbrial protein [Pantoea stewartii]KTS72224.1 fimbrial protein [Pantoea stewartii]KTS97652.1 fimbrial protein [Pantoea stewartii]KTT05823.1 fimbrial protein [Pantoea stewartii]
MKSITLITSALLAAAICGSASAADGTINFTGSITDTACKVDTAAANQTVSMGDVSASSFGSVGATASATRFTINLTGCPASATSARIRFDGPLASGNSNLLALSSGQTATNVAVGIYEQDSNTQIPIGTASAPVTLSSTATNALNFIAKYVSTGASVGAGTANASATFSVAYN